MAKSAENKLSALDLILQLEPEQLAARIAAKEQELALVTATHTKELDALRLLQRATDVSRNGKPARKVRKDKGRKVAESAAPIPADAPVKDGNENRRRIINYLVHTGPRAVSSIARDLSIPTHVVSRLTNGHKWFYKMASGEISVVRTAIPD